MPIEDAKKPWPEDESPYRAVARLRIPLREAYAAERADTVENNFSFSPAHTLPVHRPSGGSNRTRLAAYTTLASLRRRENARPQTEPTSIEQVPA